MPTTAMIAKARGKFGFSGVPVESDGYPTGLGKYLWSLYYGDFFSKDADLMVKHLITMHPAGWSHLVGCDFKEPFRNTKTRMDMAKEAGLHWLQIPTGPCCLCHVGCGDGVGPLVEKAEEVTELHRPEYAYVFDDLGFSVLRSSGDPTASHWVSIGRADWGEDEPNWDAMESAPGERWLGNHKSLDSIKWGKEHSIPLKKSA